MNFWIGLFLGNWLLNILLIEFLAIRKLEKVIRIDEKRDSKYDAFRRLDTKWFSRWWLYPTCHLALIKFIMTFAVIFNCAVWCNIVVIGLKPGLPIKGVRYVMLRFL